jgi:sulfoxide reductase heme-binding subunit YedZ
LIASRWEERADSIKSLGVRWLIQPLRDYSGRFSPLKTAVLIGLFVPAGFTAYWYAAGELGARPLTEALHEFGDWGIRFLFLAMAITPLSRLWRWPRLLLVRRMVGVMAFAYLAVHLTLYVSDEMFNLIRVASEIVRRFYLTIGFIAWVGLSALTATSTDGMVRFMGGRNWVRLHKTIYVIGILAVTHYFLQSKLNEWQPTMLAGFLFWLSAGRVIGEIYPGPNLPPMWLVWLLSLVAGFGTLLGEALYFNLAMNVPFERMISAEISTTAGIRPGWAVLSTLVAVLIVSTLRAFQTRKPQLRPAA